MVVALAADLALAAALLVLVVNLAVSGSAPEPPADVALVAAGAAALAWRRRRPLAVLAATLVPYLATPHSGGAQLPVLVALYSVATLRSPRTAALATVAASVVAVHAEPTVVVAGRVLIAAPAGAVVAERRRRHEREARLLADMAAADERLRIARELHDVVAHHLSVIVIQANLAAETVAPADPALAPIRAVVAAGREALADTRRVLGVLRTDPNPRTPQPGLAQLDELLERVRAGGLDVRLTVHGEPTPLPAALDLCAYRIIQEALTNTLRHARTGHARVEVEYAPRRLTLAVADDGIAGPATPGHGLDGMRERVAAFGGTLDAGPQPGGGYAVRARLPR